MAGDWQPRRGGRIDEGRRRILETVPRGPGGWAVRPQAGLWGAERPRHDRDRERKAKGYGGGRRRDFGKFGGCRHL